MDDKEKNIKSEEFDIMQTGIFVKESKEDIEKMQKEYDEYVEKLFSDKKEGKDNDRV